MQSFKSILVCLKLADQDIPVINQAAQVCKTARSEKVYFVHAVKSLNLPESLVKEYPELIEPLDEEIKKTITKSVEKHFLNCGKPQIKIEVPEGNVAVELLKTAKKKLVDLIIVGRGSFADSTGYIPAKLSRKAPCSVMVVPLESKANCSKILVPVDFSEHSIEAAETAAAFAASANRNEINFIHAFDVPIGYHKTGKTEEEFENILRGNINEQYEKFLSRVNLKGLKPNFIVVKSNKTAEALVKHIKEECYDIVITGSKGRSAAAAVLMGSLTEDLIWRTNVPLIAVKKKGTGMNLLESLLEK